MTENVVLLDHVARQLETAERLEDVQQIVKVAARKVGRAQGATFVLLDGDMCYYADEDAMSPLWKGQRFPVTDCISGWAMLGKETAIVPDTEKDERIPQEAYRPTFVRSMIMTPILTPAPVGAIGVYWARVRRPRDDEVAVLERLATLTAETLVRFPNGLPDPSFLR
jgi:GAF domain-containing protein